jgi:hypothetical protein
MLPSDSPILGFEDHSLSAGNITHLNFPSRSKVIRRARGESEFSRLLTQLYIFFLRRVVSTAIFRRREQVGDAAIVGTKGTRMSRTVARMIVDVLEQVGVKQIFGLIGDSLNPLADAVRRSNIEWIGVRHEEGAALAAAGQAHLTGRLAVCAGTTGPGSNHLVAGLYEAGRGHAPVLALSGEMPRRLKGIEFFQSTEPDLLFRDVSLYTQTISSAAQAASVLH